MLAVWQGTRKTPEVHDAAMHNAYEASTDNPDSPILARTNEAKKDRRSIAAYSCTPFTECVQQDSKSITAYDKHKIEPD
jgi:hypothetical protein